MILTQTTINKQQCLFTKLLMQLTVHLIKLHSPVTTDCITGYDIMHVDVWQSRSIYRDDNVENRSADIVLKYSCKLGA